MSVVFPTNISQGHEVELLWPFTWLVLHPNQQQSYGYVLGLTFFHRCWLTILWANFAKRQIKTTWFSSTKFFYRVQGCFHACDQFFFKYKILAQGPSGPDLAPRTRKVPARRSPELSEPMLFETWNHLEPLETPWSLIWGLLATLVNFCQFGDFLSFWPTSLIMVQLHSIAF